MINDNVKWRFLQSGHPAYRHVQGDLERANQHKAVEHPYLTFNRRESEAGWMRDHKNHNYRIDRNHISSSGMT